MNTVGQMFKQLLEGITNYQGGVNFVLLVLLMLTVLFFVLVVTRRDKEKTDYIKSITENVSEINSSVDEIKKNRVTEIVIDSDDLGGVIKAKKPKKKVKHSDKEEEKPKKSTRKKKGFDLLEFQNELEREYTYPMSEDEYREMVYGGFDVELENQKKLIEEEKANYPIQEEDTYNNHFQEDSKHDLEINRPNLTINDYDKASVLDNEPAVSPIENNLSDNEQKRPFSDRDQAILGKFQRGTSSTSKRGRVYTVEELIKQIKE